MSITDAPVDELTSFLVQPDSISFATTEDYNVPLDIGEGGLDLLQLTNGKTLTILERQVAIGALTSFSLNFGSSATPLRALPTNATAPDGYVNVAIMNMNNTLVNALTFSGNTELQEDLTQRFIVDIDLRKSLVRLTQADRDALGLDASYAYAIRQDHSFLDQAEVGSFQLDDQALGDVVCLVPVGTDSSIIGTCQSDDFFGTVTGTEGYAILLVVTPGTYDLYRIPAGTTDLEQLAPGVVISANQRTAL